MKEYNHKEIESKWQRQWQDTGLYKTLDDGEKEKMYVLDMFPYPSGEGLHVGHPRGYIATDVYSRMKRMCGYNVLHPMGFDAFGLPAENFAIKHKIHPREAVEKNVSRFKEQLSKIGFDYDWSREVNTTDPNFYKWTQWIFLQMFKKGLAYESNEPINWCPSCKTGLANEDLEADGTCERCGTQTEQKPLRQWVLKITDYADRMLADLDKLPKWPDGVKEAQRNWIGRKEGIIISHEVEGLNLKIDTFSAYPAWLYADTFLVLAPEHPQVLEIIENNKNKAEILKFIEEIKNTPALERGTSKEKKGIFLDAYAIDPINSGNKMPIWIANFAMMGFGTGAIRCSAHDVRDFEFAQKYKISLKEVVERTDKDTPVDAHENSGVLKDSGDFSGKEISESLIEEMKDFFVKEGYGKKHVSYRIQDWVFSRQRYWGEPIPIIHCESCGAQAVPESDLPVVLPDVKSYEPTGTGESPLADISEWVNTKCPKCDGPALRETNTMPQWAGSSWYYLRYIDPKNNESLIDQNKEKEMMPVDVYVGGDHATRHLIYARFWHKFLFDIGVVSTEEPFPRLEFLGFILASDGRKMSKRWGNVINPDEMVERFGADAYRLYTMFIGPFENTVPWNIDGLVGTSRFLEKVWKIGLKIVEQKHKNLNRVGAPEERVKRANFDVSAEQGIIIDALLHKTIKKVGEDIESFKFNTAVSAMMILVNKMNEESEVNEEDFKAFLKILAPFAPHITEEIYQELKIKNEELRNNSKFESIHVSDWPKFDKNKVIEDSITLVLQVNGKVRDEINVGVNEEEESIKQKALNSEKIKKWTDNQEIKKIIVVKNRLVNIVV